MVLAKVMRFALFSMALTAGASVVAQTACPVGVPPGDPRCGPSPNWHPGQTREQAVTPPPAPRVVERWEVHDDRYGAFAIAGNGAYGASFDEASTELANVNALARCRERGGDDCTVVGTHKNLCSTFAWGAGRSRVASAQGASASQTRALEQCQTEAGSRCDVIETVCSTPVSRWVYEKPKDFVPAR